MSTREKSAIIIEDYQMVADAWKNTLEKCGFSSISIFSCSENLAVEIEREIPDIILMDVNIGNDENGIDLTRKLLATYPQLKIVILTVHDHSGIVKESFEAGARGFISKHAPLQELENAIDFVLRGEVYLCSHMQKKGITINGRNS
jgi:DNA-binding NarL/FixJ family response regulator